MKRLWLMCCFLIICVASNCSALEECKNVCTGEKVSQCNDTMIQKCQKGANGCFGWVDGDDCSKNGQDCAQIGFEAKCVKACRDKCDKEGRMECQGDVVFTCKKHASTCLVLVKGDDCGKQGQKCELKGSKATCSSNCPDKCTVKDATQCKGTSVQICQSNGDGCMSWTEKTDCSKKQQQCSTLNGGAICTSSSKMSIRKPTKREVTCDGKKSSFWETDFMCTLKTKTLDTKLYVQSTPTGCRRAMFAIPTFDGGTKAWIKEGEKWVPVKAKYDYGGGHNNDWIGLYYKDTSYILHHSSMGFGWRACTPPDCVKVCKKETYCSSPENTIENGCARKTGGGPPPLPIICVKINTDGSVPEMLDPWKKHPGKSKYPLLPCKGDTPP